MNSKICIRCGVAKSLSDYSLNRGKHMNTCKSCKCVLTAQWRLQNAARFRERCEKHRRVNAGRLAEKTAQWRAANPERAKEAKRRCYEKRPQYYRAKNDAWKAAHSDDAHSKECQRARTRNRRARQRNATGHHTAADIEALHQKQGGKCETCKIKLNNKFHVDHVMPIALGGSNGPENLQLLCAKCNQRKNCKHPDDWAKENWLLF